MLEKIGGVLKPIFNLLVIGYLSSAAVSFGLSIRRWVSNFTRIAEPDPTLFIRTWERIFDRFFQKVWSKCAEVQPRPFSRGTWFHLGVSLSVIMAALFGYLLIAGIIVGIAYAAPSYLYPLTEVHHLLRYSVALIVLGSLSVLFHAQEIAAELD